MTIEQLEKVCHSRGSGNLECVNFAGMTDLHENNRPVNAFQLQSPEVRLPEAKQKFFIPGPLGNVALFVMGLAPRGDGGAAGSKEKVNQEWQKFLKSLQKLEVTLGKADKSLTADDVVTLATSSRKPECIREGAYAYKRLSESVESFKNLPLEARVNIARQVYEKGLSLDFQNGQAWEAIGNAARKAGFWDFSQSVFLSGGRAYRKAGDYAGAIRASKALQVGYARDTTTVPSVLRGYKRETLDNLINDLERQIETSAGRERLPYIKERAILLASVGRLDAARSEISGAARKTGNVLTALEKAELRDDFARALIRSEHSGEETYVREINAQYRAAAELYREGRDYRAEIISFLALAKFYRQRADYIGEIRALRSALDAAERNNYIGNASVILEMTAVAQKNDGRFYDAADTYNELFNQTRGGGNIGGRASRGRKKMLEAALSEKNQFPGWDRSDFRSDTLWAVYNELLDADSTGFQFQGLSQYGRWRAVREICETFKTELTQSTTEILRLDGRLYLRVANKVRDEYRKLQSGKSAEGAERRAADVERGREDGMGGEGRRAEDADSERGRERAGGKAVK